MTFRIYWAGDSTVKENDFTTYPQTGIGQVMRLFLKKEVEIHNHAENGRSTKSFIDESRLATIYNDLREGDFLLIQFGHNDAKQEDPSRYTEPFSEYQENLERFINVARNRKAYPVLITPLCRRWFLENGKMDSNIHGDYPIAMKEVAKNLQVPLIDLYESSKVWIDEIGDEQSKNYFMNFGAGQYENYPDGLNDNTHLRYDGAVLFAKMIARGLRELGSIYRDLLIEVERL